MKIIITKSESLRAPPGYRRYCKLDPDVAIQLDDLTARTGRGKFWLANHLLREAFALVEIDHNFVDGLDAKEETHTVNCTRENPRQKELFMTNEKDEDGEILDEVDLEEEAKAGRDVRRARRYRIRIDKEKHVTDQQIVTGRYVLGLVGKTPEGYLLSLRVRGGHVEEIEADEEVDLRKRGVERFMTLKRDPQG